MLFVECSLACAVYFVGCCVLFVYVLSVVRYALFVVGCCLMRVLYWLYVVCCLLYAVS